MKCCTMDNSKPYIAMMTGNDSKKHCCAPLVESLRSITWVQAGNPSDKVFMTLGMDVDQNRNYSERELCSSSFSEMLVDDHGMRLSSCLSSMNAETNLKCRWNNKIKIYKTKYPIFHMYQRLHSTVYQSRLYKTILINIALIKENILVHVSSDQET